MEWNWEHGGLLLSLEIIEAIFKKSYRFFADCIIIKADTGKIDKTMHISWNRVKADDMKMWVYDSDIRNDLVQGIEQIVSNFIRKAEYA